VSRKIWQPSVHLDNLVTLLKILIAHVPESKGCFYNTFCSGGINHDDPFNSIDNVENGVMVTISSIFFSA
jgi:hypothetical protein